MESIIAQERRKYHESLLREGVLTIDKNGDITSETYLDNDNMPVSPHNRPCGAYLVPSGIPRKECSCRGQCFPD